MPAFASLRNRVEIKLRRDSPNWGVEALLKTGVKLAKCGDDGLGAEAKRRRSTGMPGRAGVGEDLQILGRRAGGIEQREHLGLRVEGVEACALPVRQSGSRVLPRG